MTRERIEDMREVVLPFVKKRLLETNYEGLGESDAEMFAKDFDEILNLAIKALEQQPTTKNDLGVDCVDRNKAYEIIESWADTFDSGTYFDNEQVKEIIMDCANRIDELPSVTSIRPKGHWIKQNDDYYDWYECSECAYGSEGEMLYSSEYDVRTKYCPNCGAKMEREVKDGNN